MNDPTMRNFWQFNLGHLLTIAAMVTGGIGLYVQREKDLSALKYDSKTHAELISNLTTAHANAVRQLSDKLAEIDRNGSSAGRARSEAHATIMASLTARADAYATVINEVKVMANDITWMKQEMQRKRYEN